MPLLGGLSTPVRTTSRARAIRAVPLGTDVRVSFEDPAGPPITGAGGQEFRVLVRKKGTGDNPSCRIELFETGGTSPLAIVLADMAVSSTTGVVLSGTWNASLLSDASGASVECRVVGTGAGDTSLEVGAIEWNASLNLPQIIEAGFMPSEEATYGVAVTVPTYNTDVLVGFESPPRTLQTGAGFQEFRVLVRKKGAGSDPTVKLELYESGTKVSDLLAPTAVSSTTGTVVSATWDASVLSALSGANVELKVVGGGASGGSLEVGAIEWNALLTDVGAINAGFIPSEEETYGARVYGEDLTISAGTIPSEEATYGVSVSGPYIFAGFIGPLTADAYVPGSYAPPADSDTTYGVTVTGGGVEAGFIPSEEETYGAEVTYQDPGIQELAVTMSLLWDTRAALDGSLSFMWDTRAALADASSLLWDTRSVALGAVALQWTTRALASDALSLLWQTRAALTDTSALLWTTQAAVADTLSLIWATRISVSDDLSLPWSARAAVADSFSVLWATRALVSDEVALRWGVRVSTSDAVSLLWATRVLATDSLSALWDTRAVTPDTLSLQWQTRVSAQDTLSLRWTTRALASDGLSILWNTEGLMIQVTKDLTLLWAVRAILSDTSALRWSVRTSLSDELALMWATRTALSDSVALSWAIRATLSDELGLSWAVRASASSGVSLAYATRALLQDSVVLLWRTESQIVLVVPPDRISRTPYDNRTSYVLPEERLVVAPKEERIARVDT